MLSGVETAGVFESEAQKKNVEKSWKSHLRNAFSPKVLESQINIHKTEANWFPRTFRDPLHLSTR